MRHVTMEVWRHFGTSWKLRVPFLKSHLVFNLLLAGFFSPLMALSMFGAMQLAGKPARADFDVFYALMSPVGLVAALLLVGMALVLLTLNLSFMMAVAQRGRAGKSLDIWDGIDLVMPRIAAVFGLALRIAARLFFIALPFLALIGAAFWYWLIPNDSPEAIAARPAEVQRAVVVIGATLLVMLLVMLWRSMSWVLSLPLVLFERAAPAVALDKSRMLMEQRRVEFALQIVVWALMAVVLSGLTLGLVALSLKLGLPVVAGNLRATAVVLMAALMLWGLMIVVVSSWSTGTLALVFLQTSDWPEQMVRREVLAPRGLIIAALVVAAISAAVGGVGALRLARVEQPRPVAVIAHHEAAEAGAQMPAISQAVKASVASGAMWASEAEFLAVNGARVSMPLVKAAQDLGKPVYVWAVTDALSMSALLSLGVDGFVTEQPALAQQVLAQHQRLTGLERMLLGVAGRIGFRAGGA